MIATILICTYNRASLLGPTLDSIAALACPADLDWEVLVVDNNSSDETRQVVERRQGAYPVDLRYAFEPRQGKSIALNTGHGLARGEVIVYTDDDVRVPAGWLEAAVRPLLADASLAYTGGPVRPMWERQPPAWLEPAGNLGGTIAVKDHGDAAFVFEDRRKTPLGVNMAVRRTLVGAIGGFRPDLGRKGKSLLGQEQAEFFYRSRAAGARGMYVPAMVLDHFVPASRLTHNYFRRWWYWKGISQARLHRIHDRTELGLDLRVVRRLLGVPLYILRSTVSDAFAAIGALVRGDRSRAMESEMMAWYGLGYAWEQLRWTLVASRRPPVALPDGPAGVAREREGGAAVISR
jgi:glycosyltransferase involved in cell wall biosynthesis